MTLNDITINIQNFDRESLLSDWSWLIGENKLPVLATAMGDVFVQDVNSSVVSFLCTAQGILTDIASSGEEFQNLLAQKEFILEYIPVQVIGELRASGNNLEPNKVYSFKKPPVLGGEFSLDNLEQTDFCVHLSFAGQIFNKLKDVPEGSKIDSIKLEKCD
jgi:hypothetical protein